MKRSRIIMTTLNIVWIAAIFVMNYFYQLNNFDFTLKCICSGAAALLGLVNLAYALTERRENDRFFVAMAAGLLLSFFGDVLIRYDFIIGAATFALGHVCFAVAYCFVRRMQAIDYAVSGALCVGSAAFLLFFPLLRFDEPLFRAVCVVYALIISVMLGKAIGNFVRKRSLSNATVALASALFFFSDLMLVLDWFIGLWDWTNNACMGTYYPALCLLAFSMMLKAAEPKEQ